MEPTGDWFTSQSKEKMLTEDYLDLSRTGLWVPPDSILDVNGTTNGCLEITKHGLFNTRIKSECNQEKEPMCEYRACMTIYGKQCIFPFKYSNSTNEDLTYKRCSTLDVYRPWCATKVDEAMNVVEWGDCLEDCPMEEVNSACLSDPEFPAIADGSGIFVNYTTNFVRNLGVVVDEVLSASLVLYYLLFLTNNCISHQCAV